MGKDAVFSKTMIGLAIAAISAIAQKHGYVIDQAGAVNTLLEVQGMILAAYGHIVTKVPVTSVLGIPIKKGPSA